MILTEEKGERRQKTEDRRQKTGDRRQETGNVTNTGCCFWKILIFILRVFESSRLIGCSLNTATGRLTINDVLRRAKGRGLRSKEKK